MLDTHYDVTDDGIYYAIGHAQRQGWTIGLSSDRGLDGIRFWKNRLQTNGPIIAERGALVEYQGELEYDTEDSQTFLESKVSIVISLLTMKLVLVEGDPYNLLRSGKPATCSGETVVILNGLRRFSIGLHVREVSTDGHLIIKDALTDEVVDSIRPKLPDLPDIIEDKNHAYGVFIASRAKNTKRLGTLQLLSAIGINRCSVIGDSMTDYVGHDIADHYAVTNASDEFKSQAKYVASSSIAAGAAEILYRISEA